MRYKQQVRKSPSPWLISLWASYTPNNQNNARFEGSTTPRNDVSRHAKRLPNDRSSSQRLLVMLKRIQNSKHRYFRHSRNSALSSKGRRKPLETISESTECSHVRLEKRPLCPTTFTAALWHWANPNRPGQGGRAESLLRKPLKDCLFSPFLACLTLRTSPARRDRMDRR